jgi:hypothetical protein
MFGCLNKAQSPAKYQEAAVINAILNDNFQDSLSSNTALVFRGCKTRIHPVLLDYSTKEGTFKAYANYLAEEAKKYGQDVVEAVWDFYAQNLVPRDLNLMLPNNINYILLTDQLEKSIFQENGNGRDNWLRFYECYPNSPGIIDISRVGFSDDGAVAVLYMGNQKDRLEGGGGIYIYRRVNGKWQQYKGPLGRRWIS